MNLRIQTYGRTLTGSRSLIFPMLAWLTPILIDTTTATAALEKGLQDLEDLCDVVSEEFWTKREKFMAEKS